MRILLLTPEPWPTFRSDVAVLFGKYLPRCGVCSDIATNLAQDDLEEIGWNGGEALLCGNRGGQTTKIVKSFLHRLTILLRADRRRYDVIQVRDMPFLAAVALVASWFKRVPFVYWMSFPIPESQIQRARERGLTSGWIKFIGPWIQGHLGLVLLDWLVLRCADHVFVQSERMERDMAARGVRREKMTPVPMGVDIEAISSMSILPSDDRRLLGRRVIVYLGSLDRVRRVEHLFGMLAKVRQRVPDATLVLVGDTEEARHRVWLEAQAQSAGVAEHVLWTGWLPMAAGWRYVRAAEVGLSPIPRGDLLDCGSPTKLAEYLALELPVVCNDNPDQEAIMAATGCGRCVPYTADEFADAVSELLEMPSSERTALARAGRDFIVLHRSYRTIAASVAGVYCDIVAGAQSGPRIAE